MRWISTLTLVLLLFFLHIFESKKIEKRYETKTSMVEIQSVEGSGLQLREVEIVDQLSAIGASNHGVTESIESSTLSTSLEPHFEVALKNLDELRIGRIHLNRLPFEEAPEEESIRLENLESFFEFQPTSFSEKWQDHRLLGLTYLIEKVKKRIPSHQMDRVEKLMQKILAFQTPNGLPDDVRKTILGDQMEIKSILKNSSI